MGIPILILDKADFKTRTVIRNKEGHYTMIKEPVLNMYMPNNRAQNRARQKLVELKGGIDDSTIAVGNVNTPLRNEQI